MPGDVAGDGSGTPPVTGDRAGAPREAVAVLGANGSIGRHVVTAFETTGYRVLSVARKRLPGTGRSESVELDLSTASSARIAEALMATGARTVVNATGGWFASAQHNQHAHVEVVQRLMDAAALMPAAPRFVQIGSIHEYGPVPHGMVINESHMPAPRTPYARSKLAGTNAVLRATRTGHVRGVVLRAVNVFGPDVAAGSFLGSVVRKLRARTPGERLRLEVSRAERDYIDVRDLADATVRAAESAALGRAVNIGRGEALDMRRILELLVVEAGEDPDVLELTTGSVSSNGGDWTRADVRLADRLMGWVPKISVRQSLRDMWQAAGH